MQEIVTDAIVLGSTPRLDESLGVDLFTEDLGRVQAVVRSGKKTSSKLSIHLDSLNLSRVRIVCKNRFLIVDSLTMSRFNEVRADSKAFELALDSAFLLRSAMPALLPDRELWYYALNSLKNKSFNVKSLLSVLGYDYESSECHGCGDSPKHFFAPDLIFLCFNCARLIPEERLFRI